MENTATYTDGMGFTEHEWERMWNANPTYRQILETEFSEDEWQGFYDSATARGATAHEATEYADAQF